MKERQKLTDETRNDIRRLHEGGISQKELAEKYGVSSRTISRICNREKYELEKQRNSEYTKQNMQQILNRRKMTQREFHLRLAYSKDGDMIEYLDAKDNVNGYLRSIIRKDMESALPDPAPEKPSDDK